MKNKTRVKAVSSGIITHFLREICDDVHERGSNVLQAAMVDTPVGSCVVIADDWVLHMLAWVNDAGLCSKMNRVRKNTQAKIVPGWSRITDVVLNELQQYYAGMLDQFAVLFQLIGTQFQRDVLQEVCKIPYGKTKSYKDITHLVGRPCAYRAVALVNSANLLCLIVPCHRVVTASGAAGGYAGGADTKQWLIHHEAHGVV